MLNPEDFGVSKQTFTFGKHSGKASVIRFFNNEGLPVDEPVAQAILFQVKQMVSTGKTSITDEDLLCIYQNIKNQLKTIKK